MNFTTKLFWTFLSALLISDGISACGFQANQTTMCVGAFLDITDTTAGANGTARWVITLPAPKDTAQPASGPSSVKGAQ